VVRVGIQAAHVEQPVDVHFATGSDNPPREFGMRAAKAGTVPAGLVQDAYQVDDRVMTAQQVAEPGLVVDVDLDDSHRGQHAQLPGPLEVAGRNRQAMATPRKACAQLGADEAGPAENADLARAHGAIIGNPACRGAPCLATRRSSAPGSASLLAQGARGAGQAPPGRGGGSPQDTGRLPCPA